MPARFQSFASALLLALTPALAMPARAEQAACPEPAVRIEAKTATPVTAENYATAETQSLFSRAYINKIAKATCSDGMGVLMHERQPSDPKHRDFARVNYDTLYSWLLLDLRSPATITLPDTDGRYQSAHVLNEGHWMPFVVTKPGRFTLTEANAGSRYVLVGFRTQMNMQDPADIKQANALQDKIQVEQADRGEMVFADRWEPEEILALRKQYQFLREEKGYKSEDMFGKQGEISRELNNVGVAIGWGGLPKQGAVYLFYTSESAEPQTLTLKDVPHSSNSFWSVTVYDAEGFVASAPFNVNSSFAQTNADGTAVLHFGGDPSAVNYLPIYPGWTATLRIYTPQPAYFDGSWVRPELQPVR